MSRGQRLRALRWALLERLRGNLLARLMLGLALLARGRLRERAGRDLDALEDFCAVERTVAIAPLGGLAARGARRVLMRTALGPDGPRPAPENRLLAAYADSAAAAALRAETEALGPEQCIRLAGNLLLLKEPDDRSGELGVLLVKYSEAFLRFAAVYDLARVFERYQVVLEPSWIGYQDPTFHLYLNRGRRVVVAAHHPGDERYLRSLDANLVPVPLGPGYWVDDRFFHPLPDTPRVYLAALVANWAPHKRHLLLLRALREIDDGSRVILVGFPWQGYDSDWLRERAARFGIGDRVDFAEWLGPDELNVVYNQACANLLLSRKEGGSKTIYEGFHAGAPCVVPSDHEGIRPADVNAQTGVWARPGGLADALRHVRDRRDAFRPRAWVRAHAHYERSSELLERVLGECARAEGRPWTRGLARKVNRPGLRYRDEVDAERLRPHYDELAAFLRSS